MGLHFGMDVTKYLGVRPSEPEEGEDFEGLEDVEDVEDLDLSEEEVDVSPEEDV